MFAVVDWNEIRAHIENMPLPCRRRELAEQVREATALFKFVSLLQRLDPDGYRRMKDKSPRACYRLLLEWCAARFPVYCDAEDSLDDGDSYWTIFIPMDLLGVDMYDCPPESPAMEMCYLANQGMRNIELGDTGFDLTLAQYADAFPHQVIGWRVRHLTPPRGCVFVPPWNGLKDLYDWVHGMTGFGLLDCVDGQTDVNTYPMWNVDELRSLVQQWKRAKPMFDRALALKKYVDGDPRRHLNTLALALMGDRAMRRWISRPARPKTLAEIFA